MKVFVSYGRRDASDFVRKLLRDLKAEGHDAWVDYEQMPAKIGLDWQNQIQDGIRSAEAMLAVITPHAVRGAGHAADDTSVSLDEIAFARFSAPPTPIVPVLLIACTPPLAIFRLQFIDATGAEGDEQKYQAAKTAISAAIAAVARGVSVERRALFFPVFDFDPLIMQRRKDFVGRTWLFGRIDAWLADHDDERALLVLGDPGVGKTAIMAQLAFDERCGPILAAHFCRTDRQDTCDPLKFAMHVAGSLADRLPAYRERVAMKTRDRDAAAPQFWEEVVVEPLNRIEPPTDRTHLLLVDALDEALLRSPASGSIVELLGRTVSMLPSWVRVVCTSRKDSLVIERLSALRATQMEAGGEPNRRDIRLYAEAKLAKIGLGGTETESPERGGSVDKVCELANGSFLYAAQLISDLERGRISAAEIGKLPPGLEGQFVSFFDRVCGSGVKPDNRYLPVLGLMVAADAPLPEQFARDVTGLSRDGLADFLAEFEHYVSMGPLWQNDNGNYLRFFHRSLSDWLRETRGRYRIALDQRHLELARACFSALQGIAQSAGGSYAVDRFLEHAFRSRTPDLALEALRNAEIRARLLYRELGMNGTYSVKNAAPGKAADAFVLALECGNPNVLRALMDAYQSEFEKAGAVVLPLLDPKSPLHVQDPSKDREWSLAKTVWLEHARVLEQLFVHAGYGLYLCAKRIGAGTSLGGFALRDLANDFIDRSPQAMSVVDLVGGDSYYAKVLLKVSERWWDQFGYLEEDMKELFAEAGLGFGSKRS